MDSLYSSIAQSLGFGLVDQFSFDERKYTKAFTTKLKTKKRSQSF